MEHIFGIHPIMEAIDAGGRVEKVMLRRGVNNPNYGKLIDKLTERGIPFQFVPVEKLDTMSRGNHQGVIAILSKIEYIPLERMIENALSRGVNGAPPLFLMLDGVTDVRNFGAIARTAECAGVDGIILPAKGGASINSDAIKTSSGALMRISVAKVSNLREALFYLRESEISIVAATEKGESLIYEADLQGGIAIIIGSEERGISKSLLSLADRVVKIPMAGAISSLNVSAATAVVLFEAVRQRSV